MPTADQRLDVGKQRGARDRVAQSLPFDARTQLVEPLVVGGLVVRRSGGSG